MTGPADEVPDQCPTHHLPPTQVVTVYRGRHPMPMTAGEFCDTWHATRPIARWFNDQVNRLAAETFPAEDPGHTVVPPAWRRPT